MYDYMANDSLRTVLHECHGGSDAQLELDVRYRIGAVNQKLLSCGTPAKMTRKKQNTWSTKTGRKKLYLICCAAQTMR
ncbi:hypothetical protein GUJ93_ZPchr0001g32466 [Zizania palustris]|uniref:Uncharacterized protein n=1 Tax=Zizania palustris TaxID=103762 RepID=A0A8J5VA28_ZIZPA|nr:hypothetical protein GUJ93_ZPchr0001g32466 [Zizania palustris]